LWLLGLFGVAAVGVMAWVGFNAPNDIPGRSYYTIKAEFDDADNLTGHYEVKIAGRRAGQVLDPRVEHGRGVVDLQLDPAIGPLPVDTTARVRPRSAIGVRFLDLVPGRSSRTIPEGGTIPARQTSAATQLDEVLGTLDPGRRERAQKLVREIGAGVAGRGEDVGRVLGDLPTALPRIERLSRAINDRTGAAHGFVVGVDRTFTALAPAARTYRQAFRSTSGALSPIVDAAEDVRRTFQVAPGALTGARSGLAGTDPLLVELAGLARDARPALRPAPAGLRQAAHLLGDAAPGLRALRSTLDTAEDAVPPTIDLLRDADPLIPSVRRTLREAQPTVARLGTRGCDIALWARNWGSMLTFGVGGGRKDLGQIVNLRLNVIASTESVAGHGARSPLIASSPYPAPCKVREDRR